jgi:D-sedoheptulose 7-phosphate isomerase
MAFIEQARNYLTNLKTVIDGFDLAMYDRMVVDLLEAYANKAKIFVMGNGGSGATASHLACDINKGCCLDLDRKFKMICLNDNIPTMLALANDISYEVVFEEQMKNFFEPGDLAIGISGSGNSENVLRAMRYAAAHGGRTQGWCGFGGGKLAKLVDLAFVVPSNDMQQVEDAHIIVAHMLMQSLFKALHGDAADTCGLPA